MWKIVVFSVLFLMIVALLLGNRAQVTPTRAADVLRDYAAARNFRIGAAASIDWWDNKTQSDPTYGDVLKREFNMIVCENCMKMQFMQPTQGSFDWRGADALMAYAEANGMEVRGHTLVWYDNYLPDWVRYGSWTRDSLLQVLRTYIETVMTRYRGRIKYWDVVNEAIKDDGSGLRDTQSVWQRVIGADFIQKAFEYAHATDPGAILYYNDYDTEWLGNAKANYQYNMIRDLKNAGVPIEGVGFQYHHSITYNANYDNLIANFRKYKDLGLEVQITEADIRICQTGGTVSSCSPTTTQLNEQANVFRSSLRACLDSTNCTGYTLWGFTDKYTWVTSYWGPDAPLIYDANFNPKPAYTALKNALAGTDGYQTPIPTLTATPISNVATRIDVGSSASYTDSAGNLWQPDRNYILGNVLDRSSQSYTNTSDPRLYQTERWGLAGYEFPVNNGTYTVKLHFAEGYFESAGQRKFNVNIEGTALNDFDIYAAAGGRFIAVVRTFVVNVSDGKLNIDFAALVQSASVNAIEIIPGAPAVGNGTPYGGTAVSLPGRIQAENYNNGGQDTAFNDLTVANEGGQYRTDAVDIETTTDAGGGHNVGWTRSSEWLKYTVNVQSTGTYTLRFRVASEMTTGSFYLEVDGVNVTGTMTVGTGGWQTWTTLEKTGVNLTAGQRIFRLVVTGNDFNINWIEAATNGQATFQPPTNTPAPNSTPTRTPTPAPTNVPTNTPSGGGNNGTPFSGTPINIPGRVQAENYNNGGQGVAYNDTDSSNNGGQYRSDGVDIEYAADSGGGENVGWIESGEWLKYTVNVGTAGNYKFDFRVAAEPNGGTFYIEVDGNNVTGNVVISSTGGWQSWATYQNTGIYLSAGQHVIRVVVVNGGFNLNYIDVYQ
jgi:GH35 family endo-1,4-beta-xylanase